MTDDKPIRLPYTPVGGATPIAPSMGEDKPSDSPPQVGSPDKPEEWKWIPDEVQRAKEHEHFKRDHIRRKAKRLKRNEKKQRIKMWPPIQRSFVKRKYDRNWSVYHLGRQQAHQMVPMLLHEFIRMAKFKTPRAATGRKPIPVNDRLYLSVAKIFKKATFDSVNSVIEDALFRGYITTKCHPHTVWRFHNDAHLIPLLKKLLILTSTPVAAVEKACAVDSTGMSTKERSWRSLTSAIRSRSKNKKLYKHYHEYKKLHIIVGVRTNIILAAEVSKGEAHDSPYFKQLLKRISPEFTNLNLLCGDGSYGSRENTQATADKGMLPRFRIRVDARGLAKGHYPAYTRMFREARKNPKEYIERYSLRSNVEAAFSSLKRVLYGRLKNFNETAQIIEILCLAIAYNLLMLVSAYFNMDIDLVLHDPADAPKSAISAPPDEPIQETLDLIDTPFESAPDKGSSGMAEQS